MPSLPDTEWTFAEKRGGIGSRMPQLVPFYWFLKVLEAGAGGQIRQNASFRETAIAECAFP